MTEELWKILKAGDIVIPRLLLSKYHDLKLTDREFILLIYLLSVLNTSFNPKQIGSDLGLTLEEVMEEITTLTSLGLLKLEVKKVGNVRDEFVNLDGLYQKLVYIIVNGVAEESKKEISTDIFTTFEHEFGRTLSPMEYEIINAWLDGDYTEEIVLLALKEAIYNGTTNLRYIDRILHNWYKKGIRTAQDVEKDKKTFQTRKVKSLEIFDSYDWLNDDNE
ncbi:MAG: DnaD domain protein [Bacilli bacterium]|nr:DnaD domain protein [Bacilli bacterium]